MTIGRTILVAVLVGVYLFFLLFPDRKIQTLFGSEAIEEGKDPAPFYHSLKVLFGVLMVAVGTTIVRGGEFNLWGARVYGPNVRVAGLVWIAMAITLCYSSVLFLCRKIFKRS